MEEVNPVLEFDLRVEEAVRRSIEERNSEQEGQLNVTFAELRNCLSRLKGMGIIGFAPDYEVYRDGDGIAVKFDPFHMKELFDFGDIQESYNYQGVTGDSLGLSEENSLNEEE